MTRYLLRRLLAIVPLLFCLTFVAFTLTTAARGDPALIVLQQAGTDPTPELLAEVRQQLGLNDPLPVRYVRWLSGLSTGDLGNSWLTRRPVATVLAERMVPSLLLGGTAAVVSTVMGIVLGLTAGWMRGTHVDRVIRSFCIVFASVPAFWLGLGFILLFGERLRILPVSGYGEWRHLVLPVVALSLGPASSLARLTRGLVLDVLTSDFVRTAHAKGLPSIRVAVDHVLRSCLPPILALVGIRTGYILAGAILVESIFSWPGMGTVLMGAISGRDLPVIGGYILVTGVLVSLANLAADIISAATDPRVRFDA